MQLDNPRFGLRGEISPVRHQFTSFFQRIAAPISLLGFVADYVTQRRLCNFALKIRSISDPIAEGAAETVRGDVAAAHTAQKS
jgi:hypothetical protein